jgi:hypothetical protein
MPTPRIAIAGAGGIGLANLRVTEAIVAAANAGTTIELTHR